MLITLRNLFRGDQLIIELQAENERLRTALDDAEEAYTNRVQNSGEDKLRVEKMTVARSQEGIDAASVKIARDIDDIYARGGHSRNEIVANVAGVVRRALETGLEGAPRWHSKPVEIKPGEPT